MNIFSKEFLSISKDYIVREIGEKGFFSFEKALTDEFVDAINASVEQNRTGLNKNWIHGVTSGKQYYLNHMLAVSEEFYNLVCDRKVLDVCTEFLGVNKRLKAMRYYETQGGFHMQWHTDNKTDKGFKHIPGLIFIAYCMDVTDGEFQYVSGSQEWSGQKAYSNYSDKEIEKNYKDKIVSFKKPKGSIVIYNTYGIHRAKPVTDLSYIRRSLFFQVDSETSNAEPILLNPAFCKNMTCEQQQYLGFGLPAKYEIYPNTSIRDQPMTLDFVKNLFLWAGYRVVRCAYDNLPKLIKQQVKKVTNRNK